MAKTESHVARTTGTRETGYLKLVDKAIRRMVSKPLGRNESEHTSSPEIFQTPEAEPLPFGRRQYEQERTVNAPVRSGGVAVTAWRQGSVKQLERPYPPWEKHPEKDRPYNLGIPGKWDGGGRASDGPIVAMKGGNAPEAKGPC